MEDTIQLYDDNIGKVTLLNYMGSDADIVNSARVSFNKDNPEKGDLTDRDKKLIKYLAEHKHTTPFEHCTLTFRVKVPKFIAVQHMRHRTWSFNEVSRRYTSADIEFYTPRDFRKQSKSNRQASTEDYINPILGTVNGGSQDYITRANDAVLSHSRKSLKLYHTLVEEGICREQARMVLPQSMYTEYWCTANLLNVIKFLKLRMASDCQKEMVEMATAMSFFVNKFFPEAYKACIDGNLS